MKNRENKTISENEAIERIKYHMYTAEQAVGGMGMEDLEMAIKALEEVQQYRAIGIPEECLRNKDFLDYLSDKMNPNDFETYLRLYNALEEKGCEE